MGANSRQSFASSFPLLGALGMPPDASFQHGSMVPLKKRNFDAISHGDVPHFDMTLHSLRPADEPKKFASNSA